MYAIFSLLVIDVYLGDARIYCACCDRAKNVDGAPDIDEAHATRIDAIFSH